MLWVIVAMLAMMLFGLFGLYASDFIPAPRTAATAKILAIVVGLFYGAVFLGVGGFGFNPRDPRVAAQLVGHPYVANPWCRVPVMALVTSLFAATAFSSGLPCLVNRLIGSSGEMTLVVDGWQASSRGFRSGRQCARPTFSEVPKLMMGRAAACVPGGTSAADFPVGSRVQLIGRASALGVSAERFRLVAP